jgi:3'-phosphoadenosine 5'-phosphosulfate sulfotransferase (PAPS reductase)/FAD synthetase
MQVDSLAQEKQYFKDYARLPSFKKKVEKAKEVIKTGLALDKAYVGISWGKDSTVLLHLCQQIQPDILAVCYSSIEQEYVANYAQTIATYCERFSPNYLDIPAVEGNADTNDTVKDRISAVVDHPVAFIGLRAEESKPRFISLRKYGVIHKYTSGTYKGEYRVAPLAWWSWQDIWAYIFSNDLPYLDLYDKIDRQWGRTTAHAKYFYLANKDKRFQKTSLETMKAANPVLYNYLQHNVPEVFT